MTAAANIIAAQTDNFSPDIGVILGTGLGGFADSLDDIQSLHYGELPGFPEAGVAGHAGRLALGQLGQHKLAVCQGRTHYYESGDSAAMKTVIHTLKAIGCKILILTNAAGSLREDTPAGSVMLISDHISFTGVSPLFHQSDNNRFVDLVDAYDPAIRKQLLQIASELKIELRQAVYMWFCGPHFETPAEIRMAKILGADAVGMSTVPEVILARQAGMKVVALSVITNMAAGMSNEKLSHEQTLAKAGEGADKVQRLITELLSREVV